MQQTIVPVILSGGAGTRLWPVSRPEKPKQFHALTGDRSMLRMTVERVAGRPGYGAPIIVASLPHAAEIESEMRASGVSPAAVVLEPVGRNTAAAIALACLEAAPDSLLLVMPSDHVIADPEAFHAAIARATPLAAAGHLVAFGIAPTEPETGYGYIRGGMALADGVFAIDRFVEKPDRATAARYLAEGSYYWNGGIFLFRAGAMADALAAHAPDILEATRLSLARGRHDGGQVHPDAAAFAAVRSQSIDYAVMEVFARTAVVPVSMGWSDVGSWDALYETGGKDGSRNVVTGEGLLIDASGCLVHGAGARVVAIGISNLIIVTSGDTVLILPRGESQRVKEAALGSKN